MRLAAYIGISATLAAGVLVKALSERPNFYSAAVYLAQSSANLMILTNFVFLCACLFVLGLQKILYGPLRPIEIERLYERGWLFATETCLSMTIFRGSFGAWFMVMFFSLLAGKVWCWIGEGRVEILEQQPPANPRLFHTRLAISLSISVLFATYMLNYSIRTVLAQARPDMMVMFGFEFAILTILAVSTAARYAICLTEIYIVRKQKMARLREIIVERVDAMDATRTEREGMASPQAHETPVNLAVDEAEVEVEGWDGKGRWIFYLDLVTDFLKLTVYVTFFSVLLGFYGLPLHIMRDLFLSFRSFFKRVADFIRYRNATRDMNARYPNATPEEVSREDVCIICREEMRPLQPTNDADQVPRRPNPAAERTRPKKLPCGHILHFACLRSWLERQQNCPTCRRPVVVPPRPHEPAANAAGLQGNGPGNPQEPALPGHAPGNVGRNRARIINFGPLRIGFGAGGGNLMEDIAQRIHDGEQRPPPPMAGNPAGAQQHFGFGFGFGRRQRARRQGPAPAPSPPITAQLDQIERTLRQQINSLRLASNELHVVRSLQNELSRLRDLRQNDANNDAGVLPPQHPFPDPVGASIHVRPPPPPTVLSSHQQQPLAAGSNALPEGMTLPPGWTLLPLQRTNYGQGNVSNHSHDTNTVTVNGMQSAPTPSATSPINDPSVPPDNPHSATHSVVPAAPVSSQRSPATDFPTPLETTPTLPSWGSASQQPNSEHSGTPNGRASSPAQNGQATSAVAPDPSHPSEETVEKGKGKAATVEEMVDDVD